jgi:N-acetyl-anhydromuramyl-L-alanine amidase AmpD
VPNSVQSTSKGWLPGANNVAVPAENFAAGNYGRRAVVIHIMDGWMAGTRARFQNPTQEVSAHFGVSEAGQVDQYVSVIDSAYANGLSWNAAQRCWVDPQGHLLKSPHAPTWKLIQPPTNPNLQTISIELEGKPAQPRTVVQLATVVRLLQWIAAQFPISLSVYTVGETLIGHCDLSTIVKANCPGPLVDLATLASSANRVPPAPPAPKKYRIVGVPVYEASTLQGNVATYLTPLDSPVTLDAQAPLPGYAPNAGHVVLQDGSAPGFVDVRALEALT